MNFQFKHAEKLNWLYHSISFFKNIFVIAGLGFIAGFGRVIQLGGFGKINPSFNIFLEVIVESAGILIFLYVLGMASIKTGVGRIRI
jgi:hypothetical protein